MNWPKFLLILLLGVSVVIYLLIQGVKSGDVVSGMILSSMVTIFLLLVGFAMATFIFRMTNQYHSQQFQANSVENAQLLRTVGGAMASQALTSQRLSKIPLSQRDDQPVLSIEEGVFDLEELPGD